MKLERVLDDLAFVPPPRFVETGSGAGHTRRRKAGKGGGNGAAAVVFPIPISPSPRRTTPPAGLGPLLAPLSLASSASPSLIAGFAREFLVPRCHPDVHHGRPPPARRE